MIQSLFPKGLSTAIPSGAVRPSNANKMADEFSRVETSQEFYVLEEKKIYWYCGWIDSSYYSQSVFHAAFSDIITLHPGHRYNYVARETSTASKKYYSYYFYEDQTLIKSHSNSMSGNGQLPLIECFFLESIFIADHWGFTSSSLGSLFDCGFGSKSIAIKNPGNGYDAAVYFYVKKPCVVYLSPNPDTTAELQPGVLYHLSYGYNQNNVYKYSESLYYGEYPDNTLILHEFTTNTPIQLIAL